MQKSDIRIIVSEKLQEFLDKKSWLTCIELDRIFFLCKVEILGAIGLSSESNACFSHHIHGLVK